MLVIILYIYIYIYTHAVTLNVNHMLKIMLFEKFIYLNNKLFILKVGFLFHKSQNMITGL